MTEPWEDALDFLQACCVQHDNENDMPDCPHETRLATLRSTIEGLTAERDNWHRRWWIDKHHKWDSCLWNPQAGHFAEWGYAAFDAPSCPHWGTRGGGDSGCCATHDEHAACWERAADHYMTDVLCATQPKEDE